MSNPKPHVTLLCEDVQQRNLTYHFLKELGWNRHQIFIRPFPDRMGSGEQHVREHFPGELRAFRAVSHYKSVALVVVTDADTIEASERIRQLMDYCRSAGEPAATEKERVAFIVPKRNVETWLHFLDTGSCDEQEDYSRKSVSTNCQAMARKLVEACQGKKWEGEPPSSLQPACKEYERVAQIPW